jgi:hypothetical protein
MLVALVAAPGPWTQGYVSEAGTAGQPSAGPYRWGLILLAAGVALLGVAVRRHRPAALLLAGAAVLAGTSGAVPCSERCPLPPYEPTTPADVVHAGAAILGMMLLAGAMIAVARSDLPRVARRMAAAIAASPGFNVRGRWSSQTLSFSSIAKLEASPSFHFGGTFGHALSTSNSGRLRERDWASMTTWCAPNASAAATKNPARRGRATVAPRDE